MPSVFIGPEKILDAKNWPDHEEQMSLSILKDAGAPILGMFLLKPALQYTFEMREDPATGGVFVSWH